MARSKSKYKEKILEKMRVLNAELALLAEILKEAKEEDKDGKNDSCNG